MPHRPRCSAGRELCGEDHDAGGATPTARQLGTRDAELGRRDEGEPAVHHSSTIAVTSRFGPHPPLSGTERAGVGRDRRASSSPDGRLAAAPRRRRLVR